MRRLRRGPVRHIPGVETGVWVDDCSSFAVRTPVLFEGTDTPVADHRELPHEMLPRCLATAGTGAPARAAECRRADIARGEREGTLAVVTLAQPPANAMDAASLDELADVFEGLAGEPDADVTAIVLTGEGRSSVPASTSRPSSTADPIIRRN